MIAREIITYLQRSAAVEAWSARSYRERCERTPLLPRDLRNCAMHMQASEILYAAARLLMGVDT